MIELSVTIAGRELIAAAMQGEQMQITRMAIGSGEAPTNENLLTELVEQEISIPLTAYTINGTLVTIKGTFNNSSVSEGFHWTETGVFAEGAGGDEVMIAYGHAGSDYESIPRSGDGAFETQLAVELTLDSVDNISVSLSSALYVERYEFDTHTHTPNDITGIMPVIQGGTGASDEKSACANLRALTLDGHTASEIKAVDANTLTAPGRHYLAADMCTNVPKSSAVTYLIVLGTRAMADGSISAGYQIAFADGDIYFRNYELNIVSGQFTFFSWKKISTTV